MTTKMRVPYWLLDAKNESDRIESNRITDSINYSSRCMLDDGEQRRDDKKCRRNPKEDVGMYRLADSVTSWLLLDG